MGPGYSRGFKDSIGCLSERYDHKDMDSKRNLGKKVNWGFARVYSGRDWQDSGFTKLFERDAESRGSCTRYSSLASFVESGILIFRITDGGYCIHGLDSLRGVVGFGSQYKRGRESIECSIIPSNLFLQKFNNLICFLLVLVRMTQSQLLGNGDDMKNGEGNRKRLKISDNSDLIKSYSKTLIGRYMNPMEQDVKALLVTGVVLLEFCYHFRLYNGFTYSRIYFGHGSSKIRSI
ncbi:hypothetical protein Bca101_030106 [Brassica carinata]